MAGFSSGIDPITDFGAFGAFEEEDQFAAGQEAVNEGVKQKRRNTRGRALQGLSMALASFASRDPGRTAAQFIEQMSAQRMRREQMAAQEREVKAQRKFTEEQQKRAFAQQTKEAEASRGFQAESREDVQKHQEAMAGADREFTTGRDTLRFGHEIDLQSERLLADRQQTNLRILAADRRQDKQIGADKQAALDAGVMRLQRDVIGHIIALEGPGGDVVANAGAASQISHYLLGDIPREALDAKEEAILQSWGEKENLRSDVHAVSEQSQLFASFVSAATNEHGVVDQAMLDRFIGGLPEELQAKYRDPTIVAGVAANSAKQRIESGETIPPAEMLALEEQLSAVQGGAVLFEELSRENGAVVQDPTTSLTPMERLRAEVPDFDTMSPAEQQEVLDRRSKDKRLGQLWRNFVGALGEGPDDYGKLTR
jgi:hypothetical protein